VASEVDDEPGAKRHDFFRGIAGLERLFEKALEELIERRASRPEWRATRVLCIFVALGRGLFLQLDGNVDDSWHDAFDKRRETRQRNIGFVLRLSREV
jgi:hypothetical protein